MKLKWYNIMGLALVILATLFIPQGVQAQSVFYIDVSDIEGTAEDEINAALENYNIVQLGEGIFPVSASGGDYIKVHSSDTILRGSGKNTTLEGQSGGNNVVVELLALEGEHVENIGIENLSITTQEGCNACGLGIGTSDETGTLKNAWAKNLRIYDIAWASGIGGGKGITMGAFAAGAVDGVSLENIRVWGCEFYGVDTTHNYVTGGIKNLSMENITIAGSSHQNLYVKGVDGVSAKHIATLYSETGNGAEFDYCNNVSISHLSSIGNGARGFLSGLTNNMTIKNSFIAWNESSGYDIDNCEDVLIIGGASIFNEVGVDVDASDVQLIRVFVKWNEMDYRYINMG
jgi:hypothetical protein